MLDNGEIESECSSDDEIPPLEDSSGVEVVEPVDGVVLGNRSLTHLVACKACKSS